MDDEEFELYKKHCKHIYLGSGLVIGCSRCNQSIRLTEHFPYGIPIWMMKGIGIAFTLDHTDCSKEDDDAEI